MSVIYPGNYVAHLNAYRDQGVVALPGVEFYRLVGAVVINPDNDSITTVDGVLEAGDYAPQILSPDLRQDDKPRQDKPFVVPTGATIYRSAVTVSNLKAASGVTVAVDGTATASAATEAVTTAATDGTFPAAGAGSTFALSTALTAETGDATIEVDYSGSLTVVDPADQAAVLVEVCYFVADGGPSTDEINLPYKTEAGSGY